MGVERIGFVSSGLASAAPVGQYVFSWLSMSGFGGNAPLDRQIAISII